MTLPDPFPSIAREVNNWGRWGDEDELGTLNLLTDDVVASAAATVRSGRRLSLAMPLSDQGPQAGLVPGRENPTHRMIQINQSLVRDPQRFASSDDAVDLALQAATHWDGLAHVSHSGRIYNGYAADTIDDSGATRCGIEKVTSLVGRGVLLDVAAALGVGRLEPGTVIGPTELERAAEFGKVDVKPGDILLLRTGQTQLLAAGDRVAYAWPSPGPGMQASRWFRQLDVAAVATDTIAFEVFPGEQDDLFLPVHLLDIVEMGLTQGQNFVLEELSDVCAEMGRYSFLLAANPEPFVGGLGSPTNPVAVF